MDKNYVLQGCDSVSVVGNLADILKEDGGFIFEGLEFCTPLFTQ